MAVHILVCQRVASVQMIILAYDATSYGLARHDPTTQTMPAARSIHSSVVGDLDCVPISNHVKLGPNWTGEGEVVCVVTMEAEDVLRRRVGIRVHIPAGKVVRTRSIALMLWAV